MTFTLEFYRTRRGTEPALDYIWALAKTHRAKIWRVLRHLRDFGPLARRPHVDYLGDDIYELRAPIDRHQHRLLYFFHERAIIVVTSGFLKNRDRVPRAEINRARAYRADWLRRFGGKE